MVQGDLAREPLTPPDSSQGSWPPAKHHIDSDTLSIFLAAKKSSFLRKLCGDLAEGPTPQVCRRGWLAGHHPAGAALVLASPPTSPWPRLLVSFHLPAQVIIGAASCLPKRPSPQASYQGRQVASNHSPEPVRWTFRPAACHLISSTSQQVRPPQIRPLLS